MDPSLPSLFNREALVPMKHPLDRLNLGREHLLCLSCLLCLLCLSCDASSEPEAQAPLTPGEPEAQAPLTPGEQSACPAWLLTLPDAHRPAEMLQPELRLHRQKVLGLQAQRAAQQGATQVRVLWAMPGLSFRACPDTRARVQRLFPEGLLSADRLLRWQEGGTGLFNTRAEGNELSHHTGDEPPSELAFPARLHALTSASASTGARWNHLQLQAPVLWAEGMEGAGVVVASLDSGVDVAHEALAAGFIDREGSWRDLFAEYETPTDDDGHGTQTLSLVVGGVVGGAPLGVAPGARWQALRMFRGGYSSLSLAHEALEWALDPDGDPFTWDRPDVVLAAWYLEDTLNLCVQELAAELEALTAAGVTVVFAGGNTGPGAATSVSPANLPSAWPVGAVDEALEVASFSARGPSACGGGAYPLLVAPGVEVEAAELSFGGLWPTLTTWVTGTSFAAPHAAGAAVLLRQGAPFVTPEQLARALTDSALELAQEGMPDVSFPQLDLAWQQLQSLSNQPPRAELDVATVRRGQRIRIPCMLNDVDPEGQLDLTSLRLEGLPTLGTVTVTADYALEYTAPRARGTDVLTYSVADRQGLRSEETAVQINIVVR